MYMPSKYGRGINFYGTPALLLYASFMCIAANLLSVAIDHYDQQAKERSYKKFARVTEVLGFAFFISALILETIS